MSLELISPPAAEPASVIEARAHLRVDHEDEDALIARLIRAAREAAELYTGRAFITQSWKLWLDSWPEGTPRALFLPKPPVIAVQTVATYDRSGTVTTLSTDDYIVDSAAVPGRIVLKDTTVLPASLREANAIAVTFQAGYGANASNVPAAIRSGLLFLVAHFYEGRGDEAGLPLPRQALELLRPFKVMTL